ncbi:hypothetical protein OPV22_016737 [Ensete ventricosum]|uniref:Defensin-like protein n=1 Tax=Ensete ventricosum TaxID=4639 RepID=A0AAV8QWG2_ENSVE|nr:hypothetical protein OPV22_016737 [Ensete ventricosum]RWW31338.1 hypothetical protein GW17_00004019 [Ensete ventricosum]RWW62145.1 hypothetical protein BHE74_00030744 [Ensete ventricosum]
MASRCSTVLLALLLFSLVMTPAYSQFGGCTILGEGCKNDADCAIICQEEGHVLKTYRCINDPTGRDRGTVCCCTFE